MDIEAIRGEYEAGDTCATIAARRGISGERVRQILTEAVVPRRPRGPAKGSTRFAAESGGSQSIASVSDSATDCGDSRES